MRIKRSASDDVRRTHREALPRVDLDHAAEQVLAGRIHEVRDVELATLHFLQQLAQIVIVER